MQVHDLTGFTMDYVYDLTQCDCAIKSGDVLIVEDGVAVMNAAWPTMVVGASKVFHSMPFGEGHSSPEIKAGIERAREVAKNLGIGQ